MQTNRRRIAVGSVCELIAASDDWYRIEEFDSIPKRVRALILKHYKTPNDFADDLTLGNSLYTDIYLTRVGETDAALVIDSSDSPVPVHRIWYFNDKVVELGGFKLNKLAQGKSTGRKVMWSTAVAFKKLGVNYLTIETEDIGSYAWARAGFYIPDDFDPRYQMERMLKVFQGMREYDELETEVINEIEDLIINNPDDLTKIADYPLYHNNKKLTKQILIEMDGWPGELDLNDRRQMQRLKDYSTGRIP